MTKADTSAMSIRIFAVYIQKKRLSIKGRAGSMYCRKCNKNVIDCVCDDIEERLRALQKNPVISLAATSNLKQVTKVKSSNRPKI
jgi:hypothetical protein